MYVGTQWLPRIVLLHFLWLLGSLPILTTARATRVTVGLIEQYLWKNFETGSVWQDFWRAYKANQFAVKKLDMVFSGYFVIAVVNLLLFKDVTGLAAQSIWSFCLFLILVGGTIFFVQAFLTNYWQQEVSFLEALVYAGHHSKQLLLHWLLTGFVILVLALVGSFFLLVGGVTLLMSINLAVVYVQQKKQAQVLREEIQRE
jgi:uncharacterized membrane protein YesL